MKNIFSILLLIIIFSCTNTTNNSKEHIVKNSVVADLETTPVPAVAGEDAADDPAIWVHPTDINKSKIIGTNKKNGLAVYNLDGEEVFYYSVGKINNIDNRYNFPLNTDSIDILVGTNRSSNTLLIQKINKEDGSLEDISARLIVSEVDDVYGICMYKSQKTSNYYVFLNGKNGVIEQYLLIATPENKIDVELVRKLKVESQPEGMVADDENGILYVGEEDKGIWKFHAEPEDSIQGTLIANSGSENEFIEYDIEGLAIYYAEGGQGYLIASSQGNFSYAIFSRAGDNDYITSFRIADGEVDGVEETDGLDVINLALGDKFPNGLLVVQDGFNYEGDSLQNQNFKLVSWDKIASLTEPNLLIDNSYWVK